MSNPGTPSRREANLRVFALSSVRELYQTAQKAFAFPGQSKEQFLRIYGPDGPPRLRPRPRLLPSKEGIDGEEVKPSTVGFSKPLIRASFETSSSLKFNSASPSFVQSVSDGNPNLRRCQTAFENTSSVAGLDDSEFPLRQVDGCRYIDKDGSSTSPPTGSRRKRNAIGSPIQLRFGGSSSDHKRPRSHSATIDRSYPRHSRSPLGHQRHHSQPIGH